jgi:hypothetical protein
MWELSHIVASDNSQVKSMELYKANILEINGQEMRKFARSFTKCVIFTFLPSNLLMSGTLKAAVTMQPPNGKALEIPVEEIRVSQKITYIYFGEGYKADSSEYHTKTKKSILAKAGKSNFSGVVGTNPDVKVIGGKIVLVGAGAEFKGKSYETGLDADDFFSK